MKKLIRALILVAVTAFILACNTTPGEPERSTGKPGAKYLYYVHGRIIEEMGPENAVSDKFGKYEYKKILNAFREDGFEVLSEARPKNTDVRAYARKLTEQLRRRIENGVPPQNITVVGASKGSLITMLASTGLRNKSVRFVLMGNCNKWIQDNFDVDLHGRILSIFDKSDTLGGNSCDSIKEASNGVTSYREIVIDTGLDHGFLYKPHEDWFAPASAFAKARRP